MIDPAPGGPPLPEPGAALRDVARFGPYFAVDDAPGAGWLTLQDLIEDPAVMAGRIDGTAERLGGVEPRVAASIAHLGITARLLAPLLAVAAVHHVVLELDPAQVHWKPVFGGPFPLAVTASAAHDAGFDRYVLSRLAAPIVAATRRHTPVAAGLLFGTLVDRLPELKQQSAQSPAPATR